MTSEEAAAELGVNLTTLRRWLSKDQESIFPNARKSKAWRGWRIPREDVEALKRVRR